VIRAASLARILRLFMLNATLAVAQGCSSPAVGDPCLPEQVPTDGFAHNEAYVESGSVQCETRVCLVYQLGGDPREGCVPRGNPDCAPGQPCEPLVRCPTQEEISDHVYCTCRCDAGETGLDTCECPVGYKCTEVLEQGDRGVRGSYCVLKSTVSE
jgi:hypothetical protein